MIPAHMKVSRKPSAGIVVMSERWKSKKATKALIDKDVGSFSHLKCVRKRSSPDASEPTEAGFLVLGQETITWLAADNATTVASHPLAFVESWGVSLHDPKSLYYTVKPKTLASLLVKDDLYSFTFVFDDAETVQKLVSRLDSLVLFSHSQDSGEPVQLTFLDAQRPESAMATPTLRIQGERFSVEQTGDSFFGSESREVVAIFHPRGIISLEMRPDGQKCTMNIYSFNRIDSFGAASEQEFGFKLQDEDKFVVFKTDEAAHLMNTLCQRNLTELSEGDESKLPEFPLAYKAEFEAKRV